MSSLVSEHLESVRRRYTVGGNDLPVEPRQIEVPVLATTRWMMSAGCLRKSFSFMRQEQRDRFVVSILGYEAEVGHHANITLAAGGQLTNFQVDVSVSTDATASMVTELDKEYARNADLIYIESMRSYQ